MDEGHPIPQDITGFQFRLIGDMTIKQFAYLLAGGLLAWLFFSLPLFFIIKFPLALFFGFLGVLLAFIPIQGRPADTMLLLFTKTIFHPNEYVKTDRKSIIQTTATPSAIQQVHQQKKSTETEEVTFFQSSPPISSPQMPNSSAPLDVSNLPKEEEQNISNEEGSNNIEGLQTENENVLILSKELEVAKSNF